MPDGTIILAEIARGTVDRVHRDGRVEVIAPVGGGPSGCALGPDGKLYVANNGGAVTWSERGSQILPAAHDPKCYSGGRLECIDLGTGQIEHAWTHCEGRPLRAPNDLVFDAAGGCWFTDHGIQSERSRDRTGVMYLRGGTVQEVIFPLDAPNGIGLSPAGDRLYVAETYTGRVWQWDLSGPGQPQRATPAEHGGKLLAGLPGLQLLDSMAVDRAGNVCVATVLNGGITVISPTGETVAHVGLPDPIVTNICFDPNDPDQAYVTLSSTGRLIAVEWPCF